MTSSPHEPVTVSGHLGSVSFDGQAVTIHKSIRGEHQDLPGPDLGHLDRARRDRHAGDQVHHGGRHGARQVQGARLAQGPCP
jgi:hypothetical protein